jgi:hypothetical protein
MPPHPDTDQGVVPIPCTLGPAELADRRAAAAEIARTALRSRRPIQHGGLLGAGALVMALCCAAGPLLGAALGGGLVAGAGTVGLIAGTVVLLAVMAVVLRRHRAGRRC